MTNESAMPNDGAGAQIQSPYFDIERLLLRYGMVEVLDSLARHAASIDFLPETADWLDMAVKLARMECEADLAKKAPRT